MSMLDILPEGRSIFKMTKTKRKIIPYYYRGHQDGVPVYSGQGLGGGELQPYMRYRECQLDAIAQDGKVLIVNRNDRIHCDQLMDTWRNSAWDDKTRGLR